MILCFDSTSHNGFRRRMPHSYKALQEMDAVIMHGYNIVGDGTPAAIIPLLTGKTELDMPEMRKRFANSKAVDPENYIFKMLSKYGYRTAFFEDSPWIGTFQYRYNGFSSQPADHYMQAFLQEETKYGAKWWNGINKRHCIGDTPQYGFLMNMSKQVTSLAQKHFCFTFIVDISHDDFNMISSADDDLVAFIEHMRDSGKMENHLFIVMGDHGSRFSGLRETYQGKIEERLPLMAIMLPEKLIQTRPETLTSLRNNARVLTTPFDIHTTVVHAMGLPQLANDYVILGSDIPRGMSLLEPIPQSRTCGKAGILSHWCVCSKWYPVSTEDKLYTEAGVALAHFVNNVTYEVRSKCVDRKLTFIDWVMKLSNNDDVLSFKSGIECNGRHETYVKADVKSRPSVEYYQAKIRMTPGRALFEGTMKYNVNTRQFVVSDSDIQRITAYADEPACISKTHPHLNKYCYCKNKASRIPFM
ncbi:PREDICTED: uncharacterized protein LOC106125705 [Papilio xuthus]|uniref:Uncharacterized protein LOC106125705 n=1 Tax=Papilio xuthus TaxID=66420 RepID=A0AAJ6ZSL9_PAPXU|nr:PREDICTED: uncharacterized protein LOC106125705 [Papilio xuthus]